MTFSLVSGARSTNDISSDSRIVNMDKAIKMLKPSSAPFTTFLMNTAKKATADPKYKSAEDELDPRFDAINNGGGYLSSNTSLVVDNGSYFAEHDLVLISRTNEVIRVTQVVSNTLTVVRGVGTTAAAAINDDDELILIGSAQPEGDVSKTARSSNLSTVYNYTQIFRDPWEVTGTALASDNETSPHDWNQQAEKKGLEHKRSIERACLWGQRSENTSGNEVRRTTAGILAHITTNSTDAGGAFTETEFNTAMRTAFKYEGSKTKVGFAAPLVTSVLNTYPSGKMQVNTSGVGKGAYGVDFTTFTTPFGALKLVTHWELEGTKYGGYLIGVDMANVAYRYLAGNGQNRDSKVRKEIQANDADTRKDEWLTECGLQVNLEKTHFVVTGITS